MSIVLPSKAAVDHPQGWGYDGYVDDLLLRFAVSPEAKLERTTAEATPPRIDTAEHSEDIREESGFRYSRSNLSGGAGLDFLHDPARPDDAAYRFWDSRGVDVFSDEPGETYSARLLHDMEAVETTGDGSVGVLAINDTVYWHDNTDLFEEGVATAKVTTAGINAITHVGSDIYFVGSVSAVWAVYLVSPSNWTPSSFDTTSYNDLWGVKGRVLARSDNELWEAGSTPRLLFTLPDDDVVNDVVDAGSFVLAFCSNKTVYTLALDDSLVLQVVGETPFIGEEPKVGAYSQGVIGIGTAQTMENTGVIGRFYTAGLDDAGALTDIQLVTEIDSDIAADHGITAMVGTRDSIYWTCRNDLNASTNQVWRYYLPTTGYARDVEIVDGDPALSMVEAKDRIWVAVSTGGIFRESDTYVDDGYVIGPAANFFTADYKQWVSGNLIASANPSTCAVTLYESTDLADLTDPDSLGWAEVLDFDAGELEGESNTTSAGDASYHIAKIVLTAATDNTTTPVFRSYSFLAYPSPNRDIIVRVPINVSDQYESPGRKAQRVDGRGAAVYDALLTYEGESVLFGNLRTGYEINGVCERIETSDQSMPNQGSVGDIAYIVVKGKETKLV